MGAGARRRDHDTEGAVGYAPGETTVEKIPAPSIVDIEALSGEDVDFEVKKAAGSDGRGQVPASFFESYSAMANTDGGTVLLGIEERPDRTFHATGIGDTPRFLKSLWSLLNDRTRVSACIVRNEDVSVIQVEGRDVVRVSVPRATRNERPVFVGQNPLTGTFKRNYEGDFRCTPEAVRRMMADAQEDTRDGDVLEKYLLEDIEIEELRAYRQHFRGEKPDSDLAGLADLEFLSRIGAYGRDRNRGVEGLTKAGLLMFGKVGPISEVFPFYFLDYVENLDLGGRERWTDRVVSNDGTHAGCLYAFYRRVAPKLSRDIKVPFGLRGDTRIENTPTHEAVREALVNTFIHADYSGRISVLIEKRRDLLRFRNPGTMRVSLDDAVRGGHSDCRNRKLQQLFRLVGLGDSIGSGLPRIFRTWGEQSWRTPLLAEDAEKETTVLELRMVSLLPPEALEELDRRFGNRFRELSDTQRLALATALIEGQVTHPRLRSMTTTHPADLTKDLGTLVREGFLVSSGATRATVYSLPPVDLLSLSGTARNLSPKNENLSLIPESLSPTKGVGDAEAERHRAAESVRSTRRVAPPVMEQAILTLCQDRFLTATEIAALVGRGPRPLRARYLYPLVKRGHLALRFPDRPSHPAQGYETVASVAPPSGTK